MSKKLDAREYEAELIKVLDGDTIDCYIDLGFNLKIKKRIRYMGIDTWESRTRDLAEKKNLDIQAKIVSWATSGVDPTLMGLGPIPSSTKALEIAGWSINDLDLIECNEAFAAQTIAVVKELTVPKEKLNVNGGAIAIGHPIGASGARLIVTLIHEMIKRDNKKGLVTLCIGGGMGIAMCVER